MREHVQQYGRSMDRDLGKPKKSQTNTGMLAGPTRCASRFGDETNLHRLFYNACPAHDSNSGLVQSARQDGTFNKEIYR
jgi:hypothetical protein